MPSCCLGEGKSQADLGCIYTQPKTWVLTTWWIQETRGMKSLLKRKRANLEKQPRGFCLVSTILFFASMRDISFLCKDREDIWFVTMYAQRGRSRRRDREGKTFAYVGRHPKKGTKRTRESREVLHTYVDQAGERRNKKEISGRTILEDGERNDVTEDLAFFNHIFPTKSMKRSSPHVAREEWRSFLSCTYTWRFCTLYVHTVEKHALKDNRQKSSTFLFWKQPRKRWIEERKEIASVSQLLGEGSMHLVASECAEGVRKDEEDLLETKSNCMRVEV